jgi:predicted metal-dependent hydrolase
MRKLTGHLVEAEKLSIFWGTREIAVKLCRTDRRVLKINIEPSGQVTVFAPIDATYEAIAIRCQRKAARIFRELERIKAGPAFTPERHYLSGETHLVAGRPYRLEVETSANPFVRIDGSRLIIGEREPNDIAHRRRLLTSFYEIEAHSVFPNRLTAMLPPFERRGLKRPKLIIRRMSKRWGGYTPCGNITLNTDLIRADLSSIDYVICHELAHAFYGNHGEQWQELLFSVMPDWKERKLLLETTLR